MSESTREIISIEEEHRFLLGLGSRTTGSPAHKQLLDRITAKFSELGLAVQRDQHVFTRWEVPSPDRLSFSVDGHDFQIASAFPYSGTTGPAGITAPLVFVHSNKMRDWKKARGAIAVFTVPHVDVPINLLVSSWKNGNVSGKIKNPLLSAMAMGPLLAKARKAGALAVVSVWQGLGAESANGQYLPFTFPYQHLPAIWLAEENAAKLFEAAGQNRTAHLKLDAVLEQQCKTETLWAKVQGKRSDETIIVSTHTDGVNVLEENGHIGLLKLAEQTVKKLNQRSIVFLFVTGHMHIPAVSKHGQASTAWLGKHPELWRGGKNAARAAGALVLEHLGAKPSVMRSGAEMIYAGTAELFDLATKVMDAPGTMFCKPAPLIHFGEGEPLFLNNIPAIAMVSAPGMLLQETREDVVDLLLLEKQVSVFGTLLQAFDKMQAADFGIVKQAPWWKKMRHALQIRRTLFSLKNKSST